MSGLIEVLSQHLSGKTKKTHRNQYPGKDPNREPPEYMSTALPLDQLILLLLK
jgi:hypothetical protein